MLALSVACAAHAEMSEVEYFEEVPIVLSASRLSQSLNDTPASVTVIDQQMIRASGFRDIPDLLRLVPGFSVAYTRDNTWAVGYHGAADAFSRRLQVLVDGRSIYSAAYGAVLWSELPLSMDDIDRIEVVRGPNAAMYGANSFFAVINIISKDAAQTPGVFMSQQLGEQGMAGTTLRYGGGQGDLRYRLTFSSQARDRFERDDPRSGPSDKLFEQTQTYFVNGRLDYRLSAREEITAQFGLTQGDWQAGRLSSPIEPRQQDVKMGFAQFKYTRVTGPDDEWMLHFYHSRNRQDAPASQKRGRFIINGDQNIVQSRTNLEFQSNNRLAPTLRMVWGGEVREETVESPLYLNTQKTLHGTLSTGYANFEWHAHPDWLLQGGAMVENHYFTGTHTSPRIAINYEVIPNHTLRVNLSKAYRTPTFFEQRGNLTYYSTTGVRLAQLTVPANDNLAPERVLSRELAYIGQYKPWQLQWDAKLFRDQVEDYITGKGNPSQFMNAGAFQVQGGDIHLNWQPTLAIRLSAQYARVYIKAEKSVDKDLTRSAPENNFSLLGSYNFGYGWEASVGVYRSGRMMWLSDGDVTQAYTRWDARVARRWKWQSQEVEAALVGQNLGEDYQEFRVENRFSQRVYASLSVSW
jgi:iron complex outermembrane receptor protein